MDRLDRMLAFARTRVPGLRLVHKADVAWMRAAGVLMRPVNRQFMTHYTTVVGRTVYLPRPVDVFPRDRLAATVAHELVHQLDVRRYGPLFLGTYAFLLPAGRTLRAVWERRGYTVDLLVARERGGDAAVFRLADELAGVFASSEYLWMWAGRQAARAFLEPAVRGVLDGSVDVREPYTSILAAWRGAE